MAMPSAEQMLALLLADSKDPNVVLAIASAHRFPIRIASYFAALAILAYASASQLRRWTAKEGGALWENLLSPRSVDVVYATVDVELGAATFLMTGQLTDYSLDREGRLERIVLGEAARRPLHPDVDDWSPVPEELLILPAQNFKSIHLDYFYASVT